MPNDVQRENWDGRVGQQWAAEAERYDGMNRAFGAALLEVLRPRQGERVLDVGCGNGALALAIAPLVGPSGAVTGLDLSGPMLETARRRAQQAALTNVRFEQGDAQTHQVEAGSCDAAVSRFGVMFFDDPVAAFGNIRQALVPGGRLAFTCWQELLLNEWITVPAAAALEHVPMPDLGGPGGPGPFSFADQQRITTVLVEAGYADIGITDLARPMRLAADVDDAVTFLRTSDLADALLKDADEETAALAWDAIRRALASRATPEGLVLEGRAWLVTAVNPR